MGICGRCFSIGIIVVSDLCKGTHVLFRRGWLRHVLKFSLCIHGRIVLCIVLMIVSWAIEMIGPGSDPVYTKDNQVADVEKHVGQGEGILFLFLQGPIVVKVSSFGHDVNQSHSEEEAS